MCTLPFAHAGVEAGVEAVARPWDFHKDIWIIGAIAVARVSIAVPPASDGVAKNDREK